MKRPYQATAVALLVLAVFVGREALKLRYYTALGPGPGFFSLWLAVLLAGLALAMLAQATLGRPEPRRADFFASSAGYGRMAAVVVALAACAGLLTWLGYRITMLAAFLFLLSTLGRQRLYVTLLVSVAASFGVYHVFVHWLAVPLPIGVLGL